MNKNDLGYMKKEENVKVSFPEQHQDFQPGSEDMMNPSPVFDNSNYVGTGKLKNKVAIITGGDSGIGKAVSILYAKEGAKVVIVYYSENEDAENTKKYIDSIGGTCTLLKGDLKDENFCKSVIEFTIKTYNQLDILVNNAAVQYPQNSIEDITCEQLRTTFETNIYPFFFLTKAALPHLKSGSSVINTTSVTAYEGNKELIDYSATKGAIVSFTRSMALSLAESGIRVNGVAPGPIWTPLIPSSFSKEKVKTFGSNTPMKRPGQPAEVAPSYVYLASEDSTYVTGQILHVNGGESTSS